jgi:ubiquitin-like protein Pup
MIAEGLVEAARQVFEGFVAVQTGRFRRSQAGRTSLEKLRRALTPTGPCPPCDSQVQHEGYALTVLLAVLEEEAWRERLALSDGLCLDHLRGALGAATSPGHSRWIIEDQRRRLSRIAAEIEEYIRKQDYRFSHEPPGRATATLAGSWFELPRRRSGQRRESAMAEQERKTARRQKPQEEDVPTDPAVAEKGEKLKRSLDEVLDEIDTVLKENAEEFVKSYVQRGGE